MASSAGQVGRRFQCHFTKDELPVRSAPSAPLVLTGHGCWSSRLLSLPDSNRVVTICDDGHFRVYEPNEDGAPVAEVLAHSGEVRGIAALGTDRIATGGWDDGIVATWCISSGQQLAKVHISKDNIDGVCVLVALGKDRLAAGMYCGDIVILSHKDGIDLKEVYRVCAAHIGYARGAIQDIAVLGDELVTASLDGTAVVFGASNWKQKAVLRGHTSGVLNVAINERYIATASCDETVRVYSNDGTYPVVAVIDGLHSSSVDAVAFIGADTLMSGSMDRTICFVELSQARKRTRAVKFIPVARVSTLCFVRHVAVTRDGRIACTGGDALCELRETAAFIFSPPESVRDIVKTHCASLYPSGSVNALAPIATAASDAKVEGELSSAAVKNEAVAPASDKSDGKRGAEMKRTGAQKAKPAKVHDVDAVEDIICPLDEDDKVSARASVALPVKETEVSPDEVPASPRVSQDMPAGHRDAIEKDCLRYERLGGRDWKLSDIRNSRSSSRKGPGQAIASPPPREHAAGLEREKSIGVSSPLKRRRVAANSPSARCHVHLRGPPLLREDDLRQLDMAELRDLAFVPDRVRKMNVDSMSFILAAACIRFQNGFVQVVANLRERLNVALRRMHLEGMNIMDSVSGEVTVAEIVSVLRQDAVYMKVDIRARKTYEENLLWYMLKLRPNLEVRVPSVGDLKGKALDLGAVRQMDVAAVSKVLAAASIRFRHEFCDDIPCLMKLYSAALGRMRFNGEDIAEGSAADSSAVDEMKGRIISTLRSDSDYMALDDQARQTYEKNLGFYFSQLQKSPRRFICHLNEYCMFYSQLKARHSR